ncbi:alpha/beta hydrolase [Bacillus sp. Marseille-P3661]|uniref:alpha/beta hydrolase n=1 Tax=Bacillus sp. Marseille-P3661 TaxID=1936234 RepID=UPI000C85B921|nr:alpha/beta hydrolase-fold protein [Bacillus sp. Marseille-P3661]
MLKQKGKVMDDYFYSESLKENIELLIYLPPSYSPLYTYNILFTQDGRDYFNLGRIARIADELHQTSQMDQTIIIGIPYKNLNDRKQKYHPSGTKHRAYIRFLAHELIGYIDTCYPTYQLGSTRALIGDSLAGTVSLLTALAYPHTFGKVILQSPYVDQQVIESVKQFDKQSLLELYHVIGTEETNVKTTDGIEENFFSRNKELASLLKSNNYNVFYDEFCGNHTWTYWQPDLKRALTMMFN